METSPLLEQCLSCDAAGATKLSMCPLVDTVELHVGTGWYLEFTFFSVMSIRGSTGVSIIVEATAHYL